MARPPALVPKARALLAMALLSGLVLAVAPPAGAQQQRRVVIVGDSIVLGAQGPMVAALQGQGWNVTFDASVSRSTSAGADAVESHRGELDDSLVISLGANDAGNPGAFRSKVRALLDANAGVPHVYWLTIREVRDYYGPANQILFEEAAARPNVSVIDWNGVTLGSSGLTSGDGLHLTPSGASAMSQLVVDSVSRGSGATAPIVAPSAPVADPLPAPSPVPAAGAPVEPPAPAAPVEPVPTTVARAPVPPGMGAVPTSDVAGAGDARIDAAPANLEQIATADEGDGLGVLGWTLGGGFALVLVLLAISGAVLGGWSLGRGAPVGATAPTAPIAPKAPTAPTAPLEPSVTTDTQQS